MFYRPEDGHGLPHNPFNAIVSPRPIGWISSRSKDGIDNLAPYSFFNAVAYVPPQVMFASSGRKDSLNNIEATGVFAINLVGAPLADVMNKSSQAVPHNVDEFAHAGIAKADCDTIDCARVQGAPATLECKVTQIIRLEGPDNHAVFGEVTGVHMRDDCIKDGRFDVVAAQLLSRLGYRDYAQVTELFELTRPDD
ncbi:MAG: flavin reductase (DIM6/NTAB) family NADH-FMN oxidoreductase RutF [Celeribacter sp.]|jgi:flavin reductase (DIM6/NTAB) family NADH-FMN oxidoreductase RutF